MGRPVRRIHTTMIRDVSPDLPSSSNQGFNLPSLETDWKVIRSPCSRMLFVKAKFEFLQPFDLLIAIVLSTLLADDILNDDAAILMELITSISVVFACVKCDEIFALELSSKGPLHIYWIDSLCSRCHFGFRRFVVSETGAYSF